MASKLKRRSGNATVEYLRYLKWQPKLVTMVGVGWNHEEIDVMREEWGDRFCLYAFEPQPEIYTSTKTNFRGVIRNYAISNYTGRGDLYTKKTWKDGSSLIPKTQETDQYKKTTVEVTTLDKLASLMPSDAPPGLLWLDCEGSELAALQGGEAFIRDKIQVVNIEQTARPRGDAWPSPYETHTWLAEHEFLQAWTHTHRTVIGQFDSIYLHKSIFDPDHCSCLESIIRYIEWRASIK